MSQFTGLNASEADGARRAVADIATRYQGLSRPQLAPVTTALGGAWSDFANAWCSAFTNLMYSTVGVDNAQRDKLMAKSWLSVGTPVPAKEARKGDVVVFNRKAPNSVYGHVGIITDVGKDGSVQTVEGNTGKGQGKVRVGPRDLDNGIGWGTAGVVRPDVPGYSGYGAELSTPAEIGSFRRQLGSLDTLAEGATAPAWDGTSDSDFSAPRPGAVERGADLAAPAAPSRYDPLSSVSVSQAPQRNYDPLSSVQAPMSMSPATGAGLAGAAISGAKEAPQSASLNQAMFSGAPMGSPQGFGFTPSFTDKSTFTAAPTAQPAPAQNMFSGAPIGGSQTFGSFAPSFTDKSTFTKAYTAPSARDSAYGVAPTRDPMATTQALFSPTKPAGLEKSIPLAAPSKQAMDAIAPPSAPQVAYQAPNPRDDMYSVAPTVQQPVPDVKVPLPPEPAPMSFAPAMPAPRVVSTPKVAAVSAPQKAPRVAPSRPQVASGQQAPASQPQDPAQALSQQVGTPSQFMGSETSPQNFAKAVTAVAALNKSKDAQTYAGLLNDPKLGTVAYDALNNEYAKATNQLQTPTLYDRLAASNIGQAFGMTPQQLPFNGYGAANSPAPKQGMWMGDGTSQPTWANYSAGQVQANKNASGLWGGIQNAFGFGAGANNGWGGAGSQGYGAGTGGLY